jgi:hypothetical protein
MRYLFALWAAPLVLFWGWFFLSLNDINFGYVMLSRQLHDLVFQLYGQMLGRCWASTRHSFLEWSPRLASSTGCC